MVEVTDSNSAPCRHIFSFGSNHPAQLARRLGTTYESIMGRSLGGTLPGFTRTFANKSSIWNNQSVATITKFYDEKHSDFVADQKKLGEIEEVRGFAPCLTPAEIEILDGIEGHPNMYKRTPVVMKHYEDGKVKEAKDVEAYIMVNDKDFFYPSDAYLTANEKTQQTFYELSGVKREDETWRVRRASDLSVHGTFGIKDVESIL